MPPTLSSAGDGVGPPAEIASVLGELVLLRRDLGSRHSIAAIHTLGDRTVGCLQEELLDEHRRKGQRKDAVTPAARTDQHGARNTLRTRIACLSARGRSIDQLRGAYAGRKGRASQESLHPGEWPYIPSRAIRVLARPLMHCSKTRHRRVLGQVFVEVVDVGYEFDTATATRGAGLANMDDRLDALGGTLRVESTLGPWDDPFVPRCVFPTAY